MNIKISILLITHFCFDFNTSKVVKQKSPRSDILLYPDGTSVLKQSSTQPWFRTVKKWFSVFCFQNFKPDKFLALTLMKINACNFTYTKVKYGLKKQVDFIEPQKISFQAHLYNLIDSKTAKHWFISVNHTLWVALTFYEFKLPFLSADCIYDYVHISTERNKMEGRKYCGILSVFDFYANSSKVSFNFIISD